MKGWRLVPGRLKEGAWKATVAALRPQSASAAVPIGDTRCSFPTARVSGRPWHGWQRRRPSGSRHEREGSDRSPDVLLHGAGMCRHGVGGCCAVPVAHGWYEGGMLDVIQSRVCPSSRFTRSRVCGEPVSPSGDPLGTLPHARGSAHMIRHDACRKRAGIRSDYIMRSCECVSRP